MDQEALGGGRGFRISWFSSRGQQGSNECLAFPEMTLDPFLRMCERGHQRWDEKLVGR